VEASRGKDWTRGGAAACEPIAAERHVIQTSLLAPGYEQERKTRNTEDAVSSLMSMAMIA